MDTTIASQVPATLTGADRDRAIRRLENAAKLDAENKRERADALKSAIPAGLKGVALAAKRKEISAAQRADRDDACRTEAEDAFKLAVRAMNLPALEKGKGKEERKFMVEYTNPDTGAREAQVMTVTVTVKLAERVTLSATTLGKILA